MDLFGRNGFYFARAVFVEPVLDFFVPSLFDFRAYKIIHAGHQSFSELNALLQRESGRQIINLFF